MIDVRNPSPRPTIAPAELAGRLSGQFLAAADVLAERFRTAEPFRHLSFDGFFAPEFAAELLAQFPPFEHGDARNEAGQLGNKAVFERVRALGPAYAALDDLVRSPAFLRLLSHITGIPDLLYDKDYVGGGTHENRHGQDLDAHVDFNRHPLRRWHRRLNLIVYMNPEWREPWGGNLELHSDPRAPDDRMTVIAPLFNRVVVFETNEVSWHGFRRIDLPLDRRQRLTRRSIALYFYTRQRPAQETAPTHSTIYVDQPLPERFQPGFVLGQHDVDELRALVQRRDQHNQRLYRELAGLREHVARLDALLDRGAIGRLRYFVGRLLRRRR